MSRASRGTAPFRVTPLTRRRRRRGGSDPRQAVGIALGLVIALERAHEEGRVHGALTPDAVSVRDDGGVILHPPQAPTPGTPSDAEPPQAVPADDAPTATHDDPSPDVTARFPSVADPGRSAPDGSRHDDDGVAVRVASPYAPPGTDDQGVPTPDDDRYAVGAILFEMLTGTLPTGADGGAADRELLDHRPDVPPELAAVTARAVHPDAHERYPTDRYLRADLEAARASLPAPQPRRPRTASPRRNRIIVAVVLIAALLAGLWYFVLRDDDATAAVPNVVGRTADEARSAVQDAGLRPSLQYEWSPSVADGTVIRTDPGAGAELGRGADVHLVVSGTGDTNSQDQVTVPNVVGAPEATALDALTAVGLTPSVTRTDDPSVAAGVVIRQDPAPSSSVSRGSTVTLSVSTGSSSGTSTTSTEGTPPFTETAPSSGTTTSGDGTSTTDQPPDGGASGQPETPPSSSGGR